MVLGFPPSAPGWLLGWRALPSRMVAAVFALCAMAGVAQAEGRSPAGQTEGRASAVQVESRSPTYAVKAGYLYKFTPFIDWPAAAFESAASPFRLCVAGRDPFGGAIDHAARAAYVGDHPVVVVRLPALARDAACHMLFLAASQTQTPQQMLALVADQPVLTIADEGLDAPGAMVQFVTIDGRVRFVIRADTAQAAGLAISSKLLALAASSKESGK